MKVLSLICVLLVFSVLSYSQIISQWRGLDRSGVYPETGLLTEWPKEGPTLIWSVKGLPKGYSSVAIGSETIYLTGIEGDMDVLVAITMNGEIKWKTPYGQIWKESFSDSRSAPTIAGNILYVSSGNGDIACINTQDGKIIWKIKATEKFEGTYGHWGIAESLLIYGNNVFYTPGGKNTTMVALNKNTGDVVWKSESINDNPSYVSPILVERGGKNIIISVTENYVIGVDPESGKIIWKFDYGSYADKDDKTNIQTNTPLYFDGKIYITNGYNHTSVMLNLSQDAASVLLAWTDNTLDVHHGGAVKVGKYIFGSNWLNNGMGNWVCLEWETGKVKWEKEWKNKGPVISAEGMLYCYEEKGGNIALVKANPESFELVSSFKVPLGSGPHWAHPVIKNGVLYIRHGEALMAYDIKRK